jgi:hypothetical protein
MSCCPGIKCRNTGSGYVKPSGGGGSGSGGTELDTRMKDLLAARAADDAKIWGTPARAPAPSQGVQGGVPKNTVAYKEYVRR